MWITMLWCVCVSLLFMLCSHLRATEQSSGRKPFPFPHEWSSLFTMSLISKRIHTTFSEWGHAPTNAGSHHPVPVLCHESLRAKRQLLEFHTHSRKNCKHHNFHSAKHAYPFMRQAALCSVFYQDTGNAWYAPSKQEERNTFWRSM